MKIASKALSALVAVGILVLLVLAGPAHAFNLKLDILDNYPSQGDKIFFTLSADIDSDEKIILDKFQLRISGPVNQTCTFSPEADPISGCDNL